MSRERLYRTEAVVLKRTDFGEADRLLTLYTPGLGKLRAIAKGIRRPTSRKSGHLELFSHSQLLIARGRNLDIITQAETITTFKPLRHDLMRLTYAYYVAELVDRFAKEGVDNRPLYDLLLATIARLAEDPDPVLVARFFEVHLLGLMGYQPQLFHCVECRSLLTPEDQYFHHDAGGVLCPACARKMTGARPLSLVALKVLRFLQTRGYELCRTLQLRSTTQQEVEDLLHRYIVHHLERNLKSVEFLDTVRQTMVTVPA